MSNTPSNTDDVIDSRDVIERFEELENELAGIVEAMEDEDYDGDGTERAEWETENLAEFEALKALIEECEGYGDWRHGETLIRDSYFEDYSRELADDIGAVNKDASWPNNCIDWERAARELQMDYTSVDFDGVTYWIRS